MKKLFITLILCLGFFTSIAQTNSYFYTSVSNPSKTIDYVFGFYPSSAAYTEPSNDKPYTTIKAALINNKGANPFNSADDKIMILLKSGKLIRNYTTAAKEGDYATKYTTQPGETHIQYYCFNGKVDKNDIDRVWYILSDSQIFELIFMDKKD